MEKQTLFWENCARNINAVQKSHTQNITDKTDNKIRINLKILGKLSDFFFVLTSGLPEGMYLNSGSLISKIRLHPGNSKLLISLKANPFFNFCLAQVSILLWLNFHKCLYYSDWKCCMLTASKFCIRYLIAPYGLKENVSLKEALAGKCECRKLFSVFS